jgi:uncharacterized phosphosugar-binding protein
VPELAYPAVARAALEQVLSTQSGNIERAARLIASSIRAGGILQTYGTGHSRITTLELAARAGGLAAVGMLAVKDLVMFGEEDPALILDPTYERQSGLAARIYSLAGPRPEDVFLIVSNSGINSAIVEMAEIATGHGHQVVAITSTAHAGAVASRDVSGRRLADLADVVIDNAAPRGDAAVQLPGGQRVGAVSSLTGVFIAQLLTESICRILDANGDVVPVYLSANTPEGDRHNDALYTMYGKRIRPIEP